MSFVFFGEVMLRLTPSQPHALLVASDSLSIDFAGAEANVAANLSHLGHDCNMVSVFPNNLIGDKAISVLSKYGISTEGCSRDGHRIGTYFIELGYSVRPSKVVYDRVDSSFTALSAASFNWDSILNNASTLFVGGITLALSEQCRLATLEAVKTAKRRGVKVVFDMNFRRSLWDNWQDANRYFSDILEYTDLVFGNAGVMSDVFTFTFNSNDSALESTTASMEMLANQFDVDIAFTVRQQSDASSNILQAVYKPSSGNKYHVSAEVSVGVLDRLGTGDAFAAGMLHGLAKYSDLQQAIDFANAAFALSHTQYGDQNLCSETDILSIAQGNTSGYVIR